MDTSAARLPYGHITLEVDVPTSDLIDVLSSRSDEKPGGEIALLRHALAAPVGTPQLRDIVTSRQRIAIVTSDLTRPCPSDRLLPPMLDELRAAGVPDDNVVIVMALGLHRPMTVTEIQSTMGADVCRHVQVINHDPDDIVRVGTTSAGTPVELFRPVVEADVRICMGNIEFHYFAGYSGGAKAILPGCASKATIQANHAMMVNPAARTGNIEGNPVRRDIEEGSALVGIDFILNVVVDDHKHIVDAFAGDVTAAHRRGCRRVAQRGLVPIARQADIVLVSAGGHPKDINLYQAQKALDNASHAVRSGGTIILVAECPEGLGNRTFEQWMTEAHSADDILARIQREFVLGGHKAAAIAAVTKIAQIYLVSSLPAQMARQCGMVPFDSVIQALDAARSGFDIQPSLLIMPDGGSVLPSYKGRM
ncbi:MAG: nickel-dependent lactate racemase [Anaerolineae bacterium]|nr:nickel-dependent lactate racemase [Anaerolineae bacterium]